MGEREIESKRKGVGERERETDSKRSEVGGERNKKSNRER